jgi:tRNA modification GTPase
VVNGQLDDGNEGPTLVALLTPAGRGAVATLGVRGPRAIEVVGRSFVPASDRPLAELAQGQVAFGRLAVTGEAAEEVVVGVVSPSEVEVHCHGGIAASEAVAAALVDAGAQRATWQESAAGDQPTLIAVEAAVALAATRTERTAAILLDQYRGALATAIERGDDPATLLQWAELGLHLVTPWRVVLCGRPNVGKSSLINALVGYTRAIVHDQPGTTRDLLSAAAAFDGWPVELTDSAGLRMGQSPIEAEGVARARSEIAAADLMLLVCDATSPWTGSDDELWQELPLLARPDCRRIVVHNKCDLATPPDDGRPPGFFVSALAQTGIDTLERAIAAALVPDPPPPGAAVPFTERQVRLLILASHAARQNDPDTAQALLVQIVRPPSGE